MFHRYIYKETDQLWSICRKLVKKFKIVPGYVHNFYKSGLSTEQTDENDIISSYTRLKMQSKISLCHYFHKQIDRERNV